MNALHVFGSALRQARPFSGPTSDPTRFALDDGLLASAKDHGISRLAGSDPDRRLNISPARTGVVFRCISLLNLLDIVYKRS